MIGSRSLISRGAAVAAIFVAGAAAGPGGDPGAALATERLVEARAQEAATALDAFAVALEPALDEARRGAARVVSGTQPAGEPISAAADIVEAATDEAAAATRAVTALNAARAMENARASPLEPPPGPEEVASLAAELRSSGSAADAFAERRQRSARVLEALDAALQHLVQGRVAEAAREAAVARAHHAALRGWGAELATVSIWLATTDAMIRAVESLIEASRVDDDDRAASAAREFAALSDDAVVADRALRVAIGEGGGAATASALEGLGRMTARVEALRSTLTAVRREGDR